MLLIQEKLDGIKSRYGEMTAGSSKALRTLEQALQLSTRFASAHDDLNQWLDTVEAELNNMEPDATPAYQERQKVRASGWEDGCNTRVEGVMLYILYDVWVNTLVASIILVVCL